MKDIKRVMFLTVLITGMAFILSTNSQSFIFENGNALADEKSESLKKLLSQTLHAIAETKEPSKGEASKLRRISTLEKEVGIKHKAYDFWKHGEYTDLLLGWKRKEGDIKE